MTKMQYSWSFMKSLRGTKDISNENSLRVLMDQSLSLRNVVHKQKRANRETDQGSRLTLTSM